MFIKNSREKEYYQPVGVVEFKTNFDTFEGNFLFQKVDFFSGNVSIRECLTFESNQ